MEKTMTKIEIAKWPAVAAAVRILLADQGLEAEAETTVLPVKFDTGEKIKWHRVNRTLALFSEEELEEFCIGEQDPGSAAAAFRAVGDGSYAYDAVEELFTAIGG